MNEDQLEKTLDTVHTFTQFSDTKAAAVLTLQTASMVYFLTSAQEAIKNSDQGCAVFVWKIAIVLALIASVISLVFAGLSIWPRLDVGQPSSLIFFGHVGRQELKDYLTDLSANKISYEDDLRNQVWTCSKIAWRKYMWVGRAIGLSIIANIIFILPWLINAISSL